MSRLHPLALVVLVSTLLPGCAGKHGSAEPLGTQAGGAAPHPSSPAPTSGGSYAGVDTAPVEAESPADYDQGYADRSGRDDAVEARPERSPGLGTAYGETHSSGVDYVGFQRAHHQPDTVLALWYDDGEGIAQRIAGSGHHGATTAAASSADGQLVLTVLDEYQRLLPAQDVNGRRFVVGQAGRRYMIGVENHGGDRVEAVVSVDGLDVIDGSDAGFENRGYVVEPYTSTMIEGWRTSESTVAAFRFSDLRDSYAAQTGRARNVGVIGVAFFGEAWQRPWREIDRRDRANPFPGN